MHASPACADHVMHVSAEMGSFGHSKKSPALIHRGTHKQVWCSGCVLSTLPYVRCPLLYFIVHTSDSMCWSCNAFISRDGFVGHSKSPTINF
jgi:hypothetical protein